ncbi:MAG: magnesium chelatase domain-containing protein, partial [Terriglobales bacterium]
FQTVGLPGAAVRESRERLRSAMRNCGYDLPAARVVINLAPADVRKEGSGLDLPAGACSRRGRRLTGISPHDPGAMAASPRICWLRLSADR